MKKLRGRIYIFFPEDRARKAACTEYFYLNNLLDELVKEKYGNNIQFYSSKKERDFIQQLKVVARNVEKKPDFYEQPNLFYIFKDIDYSTDDNNKQQLSTLFKKYFTYINDNRLRFNIILSSRAWETWLCMYDHQYNGRGNEIEVINGCSLFSGKYEKKREWYDKNGKLYDIDAITNAYNNCQTERNNSFYEINGLISPETNFQNNIRSEKDIPSKVNALCNIGTFSYVDYFLHNISHYIR